MTAGPAASPKPMVGEHEETIAALSTPAGESGIAVVRMSGPGALTILGSVFAAGDGKGAPEWRHRRVYHGRLVDGGEVVDDVVCAIMRAPESYTGEDVVEISCHGNAVVITRLLNLLFSKGARAAEAGEFTKRAFLNGKYDLIQAEAVADLIHARSELQRQVAQTQLAGALSKRINALADEMLGLLGNIEANIDFIEEGIDTLDVEASAALLESHKATLDELLASSAISRPFREGYGVAIAGPVNAGKSSLFNRLLGENRAIVTEIPGTTRDVLREPIVLEGLLFVLHDTAGLRGTEDRVESIGIDLAESAADVADVVLFVLDASAALDDDARRRLRALEPGRAIVVLNKTDLDTVIGPDDVRAQRGDLEIIEASVTTGDGLAALEKTLIDCVGRDRINWIARERIVLNSRLISLLEEARKQVDALLRALRERAPLEILALDAREALQLYEKATGKRYTDDLLDTIFSRFCIGK